MSIKNNVSESSQLLQKYWPSGKKLFQLSHVKKINNNKIKTIFLKKESPILKIILLPKLILEIFFYLKNSKKKL